MIETLNDSGSNIILYCLNNILLKALDDVFLFMITVSLNSVIAVMDADFHSLPSTQHRQQYGPVCFYSTRIQLIIFFLFKCLNCLRCGTVYYVFAKYLYIYIYFFFWFYNVKLLYSMSMQNLFCVVLLSDYKIV